VLLAWKKLSSGKSYLDPGQNQGTDTEGIEIIGQVEDTVTKTQITAITTTREAVNFNLLA